LSDWQFHSKAARTSPIRAMGKAKISPILFRVSEGCSGHEQVQTRFPTRLAGDEAPGEDDRNISLRRGHISILRLVRPIQSHSIGRSEGHLLRREQLSGKPIGTLKKNCPGVLHIALCWDHARWSAGKGSFWSRNAEKRTFYEHVQNTCIGCVTASVCYYTPRVVLRTSFVMFCSAKNSKRHEASWIQRTKSEDTHHLCHPGPFERSGICRLRPILPNPRLVHLFAATSSFGPAAS
jgi:hypothetical protein